MSMGRMGSRAIVLGGLATLTVLLGASSAWAEPATFCVKATKVSTPKKHYTGGWNDSHCTSVNATHEGKYEKLASLTGSEEQELKALLKYVKVQASGVGGKPTVQFSGANVQVVNGAGKTETTNGAGNLVIGYDEAPGTQTGSHDLILGQRQTFTSFGGIDAGIENTISGEWASVSGGLSNTASGHESSVSGGFKNEASGGYSSVSGGGLNTATGSVSSVSGGSGNQAEATYASVSGGMENIAVGVVSSISGGDLNKTGGAYSSVSGGQKNEVFSKETAGEQGLFASIFGGKEEKTAKNYNAIP
jgi:hypothetical protein